MDIANFKLQIGLRVSLSRTPKVKIFHFTFFILPFAFLLSGCVSLQVGGDIQQGRMQLLYGDPKAALAHFQRAAELDPNYRLHYSIFPEGVWTYVGRAYYASGRLVEARQALERARTREEDSLARLYLGLVLAQDGDRARGLKEIEAGLKGVVEWYDWVEFYHMDGPFWDPGRQLRSEIHKQLAAMGGREADLKELSQNAARLGREIEIEVDRANEHKLLYWRKMDDRRS
jgi:tetratricopeptide (TPR) repeat protein